MMSEVGDGIIQGLEEVIEFLDGKRTLKQTSWVEVVRCKDCRYSRPRKSGIKLHCAWWYRSVEDEDFCSRGRQKDG